MSGFEPCNNHAVEKCWPKITQQNLKCWNVFCICFCMRLQKLQQNWDPMQYSRNMSRITSPDQKIESFNPQPQFIGKQYNQKITFSSSEIGVKSRLKNLVNSKIVSAKRFFHNLGILATLINLVQYCFAQARFGILIKN